MIGKVGGRAGEGQTAGVYGTGFNGSSQDRTWRPWIEVG